MGTLRTDRGGELPTRRASTPHSPLYAGAERDRGKKESISVGHGSLYAQRHVNAELVLGGGHDHSGVHPELLTDPKHRLDDSI
jgi:hypothetical protein